MPTRFDCHNMNFVALGGGSGLSMMLRGVKYLTEHLSVIVTVADDGGSSGTLRHDMNILPPGDIRNCIMALSEKQTLMEKLFAYRFKGGTLHNQSFGNLFLAAMTEVSGSFDQAISQMSSILNVKGEVMPVTMEDVNLKATLKNNSVILGESKIPQEVVRQESPISQIELVPNTVSTYDKCLEKIAEADVIIVGPGSLYTSLLPNFLVGGIAKAVSESKAKKIFICNVMTQWGETDGFSAYDHIEAFEKQIDYPLFDYCIANSEVVPDLYIKRYKKENKVPVMLDEERFQNSRIKLIKDDILYFPAEATVRHDYVRLAQIIAEIACGTKEERSDCHFHQIPKQK